MARLITAGDSATADGICSGSVLKGAHCRGTGIFLCTPIPVARGSVRAGGAFRDSGESEASRILNEGKAMLGLPIAIEDLAGLKKSDERKVLLATVLRTGTSVSNGWISEKLAMGHPNSISRLVSKCRADKRSFQKKTELQAMLAR